MYLINTKTLKLTEFIGKPQSRSYAILSHTWGNEEIKFSDLQHGDVASLKHKTGWKKLVQFCGKAAGHGYRYAWMDTCCIDKSSSAELSEAINSMFRWYWDAGMCYIHLADVKGLVEPAERQRQLERSRYFTRGWTLQELLAPKYADFYDHEWRFIGHRESIASNIAGIVHIPIIMFTRRDLIYKASVAQRMSWASRRQTKREEDMAYSLLGLFDVNMPLLYGEGARKSFQRLQEEIMRTSRDQSIFGWGGSEQHSEASNLLANSPADFQCAGNIQYVPSVHNELYALTKRGLQMTVRVKDRHLEPTSAGQPSYAVLIVPLNFGRWKSDGSGKYLQKMCITLLRSSYENLYERVNVMELSNEGEKLLEQSEEREIFIARNSSQLNALFDSKNLEGVKFRIDEPKNSQSWYEILPDDWKDIEEAIASRRLLRTLRFISATDLPDAHG